MKIDALARYGLSGQIIKRWSHDGIRFLLPIQSESVCRFGLLDGKSLVVSGPGTSGKTFCGELASIARAGARQKTVVLVPLKAIAEEKYKIFHQRYSSLGIRVRLATRDHTIHDLDIIQNRFDIAIMIYEKFNCFTANDISAIKAASCFVMDEFQMISDPVRGIEFELAVIKIRALNPAAQVVVLMGGGSSPGKISQWLKYPLLEESRRPVDLRLGVLHRGNFHFREFNALNEGDERWLSQIDSDDDECLSAQNMAAIRHLSGMGEQILVFGSSKKNVVGLADYLQQHLDQPPAEQSLVFLRQGPPSRQNEILERCLRKGVAFHHADLDDYQREIIENGFKNGEIKILASTSTLASGVNLPARNVFIEAFKYTGARTPNCRESLMPLSGVDFHQAAGRAGRLGSKQPFGRAIMTAATPFEQEVLWEKYIYGQSQDPAPGMTAEQLPELLLHLLSCGAATHPDDLESLCKNTYMAFAADHPENFMSGINQTLIYFEKTGMVNLRSWGKIEPTRLGQAASSSGLEVKSAVEISEWLADLQGSPISAECLVLAVGLKEWTYGSGGYSLPKSALKSIADRILQKIEETAIMTTPYIVRALQDYCAAGSKSGLAGILFALEWSSGRPTYELEADFGKGAGGLKRDSATLCWILRGIEKIARAILPPSTPDGEPILGLNLLVDKLQHGVGDQMLPLAKALRIDREFIRRLYDNGVVSLAHLYEAEPGTISGLLPKIALLRVEYWRKNYQPNMPPTPTGKPNNRTIAFTGNRLRQREEVIIDGVSVYLQPRLLKYLQKLWWGYCDGMPWVHKDTLDTGLNQAKYLSKLRQVLVACGAAVEIASNGGGAYALVFPRTKECEFDQDPGESRK
jgi:helicase